MSVAPTPVAVLVVIVLATSACTTHASSAEDGDTAALGYLADRADRLATTLDAGEACAATDQGDELVARVWAAVASGEVPTAVAVEVEEVVTAVTADLACEEGAPEDDDAEEAPEDPDDADERHEGDDDGDDGGDGGDEGDGGGHDDDRGSRGGNGRDRGGPPKGDPSGHGNGRGHGNGGGR